MPGGEQGQEEHRGRRAGDPDPGGDPRGELPERQFAPAGHHRVDGVLVREFLKPGEYASGKDEPADRVGRLSGRYEGAGCPESDREDDAEAAETEGACGRRSLPAEYQEHNGETGQHEGEAAQRPSQTGCGSLPHLTGSNSFAGTRPETVVPRPGAELTSTDPPSASTRSFMFCRPDPSGCVAGSNPSPSSSTLNLRRSEE